MDIYKACEKGDLTYIKSNKFDINGLSEKGWTPLIIAAWNGQLEVCAFLISAGADCNFRTAKNGTSVLMYAKNSYLGKSKNNQYPILELLIESGANIRYKDHYGKSIIDYLAILGEHSIINFLRSKL